jgi:hypothetical protein
LLAQQYLLHAQRQMMLDEQEAIDKYIVQKERIRRLEERGNKMNKFAKRFADLSQRIKGAHNDVMMAVKVRHNLEEKREELLLQNAHDLEIGVYDVPGGHVVISRDENNQAWLVNYYAEN